MEYGGPEFGHWGGEGDESDATSAQEILQLFAQIGGEDISLDEGVTQHGDTDRTSFFVVQRLVDPLHCLIAETFDCDAGSIELDGGRQQQVGLIVVFRRGCDLPLFGGWFGEVEGVVIGVSGCRIDHLHGGSLVEEGRVEIGIGLQQFGILLLLDQVRDDVGAFDGHSAHLETGQKGQSDEHGYDE